jgi:hypothetical protein
MKYEVGMRWIWKDDHLEQVLKRNFKCEYNKKDDHGEPLINDSKLSSELRGYIIDVKPRVGDRYFITIKWENGRIMQYTDDGIKDEPRLSLDKGWYRNDKLELLGI